MMKYRTKEWERINSDLYKMYIAEGKSTDTLTLQDCREFSVQNIADNLTKIDTDKSFIELGEDDKFCFIGRVDTNVEDPYNPTTYYKSCQDRAFMSFSTLTHENISHYKNSNKNYMFVYNMPASAIVHVFPCDADTSTRAKNEEELTCFPSLWITLDKLNLLTKLPRVYNQVTCRTKYDNGEIIKPAGLLVFNEMTEEAHEVADKFEIPVILAHTKKNVITYDGDIFKDQLTLEDMSYIMKKEYGLEFLDRYYADKGFDNY